MNSNEIRAAYQAGRSNWEVLHMVVAAGREYPDAVWVVSQALRMDSEAVEDMELYYFLECQ